ncbi:MAG: gluconate 2-dehydrogenase subunit 3 family protein [Flavobacteriaceae bacterium]|nr:gluconate 2-dehydrogenase subunit 3 family protein [Flavobacteriaceae bacterium]
MDRRESIKSLFIGSLIGGLALESCVGENQQELNTKIWEYQYGRTPKEKATDERILSESFFSSHELKSITVLGHLVLPPNENGSIEDAGVPEFIEFMAKDYPNFQDQIRGGLMNLDHDSNSLFGKRFILLTEEQQKSILDKIAFPDPELSGSEQTQPIQFFSLIKNLIMTGYFTSEIGIKELGYAGNIPNVWNGVPQHVLDDHGLEYDPEWIAECIDQDKRNDIATWDSEGNLIT